MNETGAQSVQIGEIILETHRVKNASLTIAFGAAQEFLTVYERNNQELKPTLEEINWSETAKLDLVYDYLGSAARPKHGYGHRSSEGIEQLETVNFVLGLIRPLLPRFINKEAGDIQRGKIPGRQKDAQGKRIRPEGFNPDNE